ncbi:MAG TPA: MgtC/SapB family protein [Aestuariivirgaceae bacterium]|jgi:putative Mg2+ transporter-C (MgtC) family protein
MSDVLAQAASEVQVIADYGLRLFVATILGAVIGFDRELRNRPAGLRTHMIMSLAAGLFTILTLELHAQVSRQTGGSDPIRIIEAITVGVSFLAAGTIIQSGRNVQGLTTGAGMWLAGAVGLACGLERYGLAVLGSALALFILAVLIPLESWIARVPRSKDPAES